MDEVGERAEQGAANFNELDERWMTPLSYAWTQTAAPTWALQTGGDDLFHVGAVEVGLHDAVQSHVWPEDQLVAVVEVQGDGVLQIVEQQGVLRAVGQDLTDVDAVGEEEHRLWTWRSTRRDQDTNKNVMILSK